MTSGKFDKEKPVTGYLYALADPRKPFQVRYIGITIKDPVIYNRTRYRYWSSPKRKPNTHLRCWLRSLADAGVEPVVSFSTHEGITWQQLCRLEISMIAECRAAGDDLVNATEGGEGAFGRAYERTPEHRAKLSAATRQAFADDPTLKQRQADARRATMMQRYGTLDASRFWVKPRVSPQKGKPWTEEQKAKARASHRARWERYRESGRDREIAQKIREGMKRVV